MSTHNRKDKNDTGEPTDRRFVWFEQRINAALKLKPQEIRKLMDNEDNRMTIQEFLELPDRQNVFVVGTTSTQVPYTFISGEYDHSHRFTHDFKRKVMYFTKYKKEKLLDEKVLAEKILFGDTSIDVLQSLYDLTNNIMYPLIKNPANINKTVPDVRVKELKDNSNKLQAQSLVVLGRSHYRTLLPIPAVLLPKKIPIIKDDIDRDLLHLLEEAVVDWSSMIRIAIAVSPEDVINVSPAGGDINNINNNNEDNNNNNGDINGDSNQNNDMNCSQGPQDVIDFWEDKEANLLQLEEQLSQPFVLKTMVLLNRSGSAYYSNFCALENDLHESLLEASEASRFLRPLRSELNALNPDRPDELVAIEEITSTGTFKRIFRLLLTIWGNCKSLATIPRMVHFISTICNELMRYCRFSMESVDILQGEPEEVMKAMTLVLNICGDFKIAFFETKARAARESVKPWRFQNSALFKRLDLMLERFHDLLDVIETIILFTKGVNIRVGGPASVALSDKIDKVYERYIEEYSKLQGLPPPDLLDIDSPSFERVFVQYRAVVHELEQELSKVVEAACYDAGESIPQLFKVVDSFDGFTDRPVGRENWTAHRQPELLVKWQHELLQVQDHFRRHTTIVTTNNTKLAITNNNNTEETGEEGDESATRGQIALNTHQANTSQEKDELDQLLLLFPNVPPTSAKIMWGKSLIQRLQVIDAKMMELDSATLRSPLGEECQALYRHLMKCIQKLVNESYENWARSAGEISVVMLRTNLLNYDQEKNEFRVNFNPELAKTLKEAVFLDAKAEEDGNFTLPEQVALLNKSRDVLRLQTIRLNHICTTINIVNHKLRPCEVPLVQEEAKNMGVFLMKGVQEIQWCSTETVEDFIRDGMSQVKLLERAMTVIHTAMESSIKLISDFSAEDQFLPLTMSKSDVHIMTESEFRKKSMEHIATRRAKMRDVITVEINRKVENALVELNEIKSSAASGGSGRGSITLLDKEDPRWTGYIEFFSTELGDAFIVLTLHSLKSLSHQLDSDFLQQPGGAIPLLDVKLGLSRPYVNKDLHAAPSKCRIAFDPPLITSEHHVTKMLQEMGTEHPTPEEVLAKQQDLMEAYPPGKYPTSSVEGLLENYIDGILDISSEMSCLDSASAKSTYRGTVEDDENVIKVLGEIRNNMTQIVEAVNKEVDVILEYQYLFEDNIQQAFHHFIEERAQIEAERPHDPILAGGPKKRPYFSGVPLEDFEAKIRQYEELHDVLSDLPMSIRGTTINASNNNTGSTTPMLFFIKIDTKPIRNALLDICNKWEESYTGYLTSTILRELEGLYTFIQEADEELNQDIEDGNLNTLKKSMRCIRGCRQKNKVVEEMHPPMSEAVTMLKRHPNSVRQSTMHKIEELRTSAGDHWNTLYRKSLNTREQHSSAMDRESHHVKVETVAFEEKIVTVLNNEMRNTEMYSFNLPREHESYAHIDKCANLLLSLEKETKELLDLQELFELTPSEFRELKDAKTELVMVKHVWDVVNHVITMFDEWMSSPFAYVDVDGFMDEIRHLQKQLKMQPVKAKEWHVYKGLHDTVQNMNKSLPLCAELRSPAMRDRHWEMLFKATSHKSGVIDTQADDFTLQKLIDLGIHLHSDEIYGIVEKAQKELHIEGGLVKIEDIWSTLEINLERNNELDIALLTSVDGVIEQLEGDSNILQSMMANRFVDYFLERVQHMQTTLSTVDTCLMKWMEIQRKWVNLFPIFILSADIREQLPEDARRFQVADDFFRQLMQATETLDTHLVAKLMCTTAVLEKIKTNNTDSHESEDKAQNVEQYIQEIENILTGCEKSLADYLEMKRKIFPRFFFVSNNDLVDIMSKGSDPKAVMVHMSKIVDSIEGFLFDGNPGPGYVNTIAGDVTPDLANTLSPVSLPLGVSTTNHPKGVWCMESMQGERVRLSQEYICDGPVEQWLEGIVSAIQVAMKMHISEAHAGYVDRPRHEWMYLYPCQAIIVASRSYFTAETQQAFQLMEEGNEMAMKEYLKSLKIQLDTLIKEVLTPKEDTSRKMLVHLITIDVHNRDVIQSMVDDKVDSVEAFAWASQLRYYWDEKRGGSEVRICDAEFQYGYEYVGLCGCLVITKLTDRCYNTLSQALRLKRGGAPAGPAGTGKTETTKDLARNLGIACYVFNCSDQMNYITLGQVFKGLAMSGSWGCFDEFNRISIEVLSVVATQVNSILNALKAQKTIFRFMDEEISLINRVGMFITMNPGYAGRTELPENIKSLFRPCAMCVPDLKNICEIMLAAEGFGDAKDLALKFVTLYRLNKELLSPQDHYDWGLRAVKSVLYIAGSLKRGDPNTPERRVLLRALRDTNLAKLSKDDVYVFMGLIKSLFPNLEVEKKRKADLDKALKEECKAMGNFPGDDDIFILKCAQYEEILHVRHSVFILGPAGCGKTQMWKCLQGALHRMGDKAVSFALNPKAITSNEMYGFIHPQTKEWRDGVLSNVFRQYAFESKTKKNTKWIVLDGIVDAEWIESMNTVMDDNKMLTLVSNERIPLTESMRMIFEVSQLRNASPATVSRGGVVFINETDLGWVPLRDKWLASRNTPGNSREPILLETLFDRYVPPVFEYFRRSLKTIIPVMDIAIIQTICFLLEGLLKDLADGNKTAEIYEKYFAFATIWAFGGPLPTDGRIDYRYQFSSWWKKENPHLKMSENGTVFDYFVDAGDKFEFKPWSDLVHPYQHDPDLPMGSVTVQTPDTVRMNTLLSFLVDNAKPVMVVGTAGTGKGNIILSKLKSLDTNEIMYRVVAFNARTSSLSLQGVMDQNLEKRSGKVFGPLNRKKLIFFMDDMNMPNPDKYGTQDAIALMQQHINYGFWFDRTKMTPKEIIDVRYVGAMNPKSGTFNILDRLVRHYAVFATSMPDKTDLGCIYGQILQAHLADFPHNVKKLAEAATNATIDLHAIVTKNFLPTAILFHYQWNMRELFNIFQGLCNMKSKIHQDGAQFARLWAHECKRTFRDRMPTESDAKRFDDFLLQVQKENFAEFPPEALLPFTNSANTKSNNDKEIEPLALFWAPLRSTRDGDENVYDECDVRFTERTIKDRLDDYNTNVASMDLVLFDQAIEHVCRISRILSNQRGNGLLVGVGGSGKQSLAKLASYILGLEVAQILVTSSYNITNFQGDMQEIYKKCGLKGIPHTFLITDQQIVCDDMLVYLNDMLNSGNVPDLFIGDDRDNVISSIMSEVKQTGHPDYSNPDVCWEYFIEKVRSNLHIMMCMSPISPKFAQWCRQFPAISNTTVIDWFHPWPRDALRSVAQRFLEDLEDSSTVKQSIAEFISECHDIVTDTAEEYFIEEKRRCYTTPKSFLGTIQLYKDLLRSNREKLGMKIEKLTGGISKIQEAAEQVAGLQEILVVEAVEVEEAREKIDKMMEHVGREKEIVEEQRKFASVEENKTNKIVQEVEGFAAECQRDLAAAQPLVEEAKAALNTLDKASLTELKSMARPPTEVAMVAAAVKVLTTPDPNRISPVSARDWGNCKLMMSNITNWMKELLNFDQDNIPQPCVDAIQMYVNNPSFNPQNIVTKSFAASGLCKWVLGMNAYHTVRCQVRPKEQRLAEAQERLASSRHQLKKVQDKVASLQNQLDILIAQFNEANDTARQIQEKAQKTVLKTQLAARLVNGLSGEKIRWGKTIEDLKERGNLLVGDVLLASAFVSYIGPFTKSFRSRIMEEMWQPVMKRLKIAMTPNLDVVLGLLATEADIASWCNDGLQQDPVSVQNGAIVTNCSRWPLIIDPQLQGIRWIKTQQERMGLVTVQQGQKGWLDKLIHCIEEGLPCLIEGLDETIDPVLDNVLGRVTYRRGSKPLIKVGSRDAVYHPKFRLFLQTRRSNPVFSPEINAQTTVINFMVTESGLEDQLLAVVVNHDRHDLEEKRANLIRNMNTMTIELQQCEDGLLAELTNATGDILENVTLVGNLEATKKKATDISQSMQEAIVTQKKIAISRESYQPCAARGALIFFVMDQLCKIDHMYQYSLESFMVVFNKALANAPHPTVENDDEEEEGQENGRRDSDAKKADNSEEAIVVKRVELVSTAITEKVYAYVAGGMFERHKLILSSMITFAILLKSGEICRKQLDFLLQGKKKGGAGEPRPESVKDWCPEANWNAILALSEIGGSTPPFSQLPSDVSDSNRWKLWQDTDKPEEEKMPTDWKNLSPLQRLMVLRCLRPDRLTSALENFVAFYIGKLFISDQAVPLEVTFKTGGSSPVNPFFFIISPGVDPVRAVEALGNKLGYTYDNGKLYNISLGQGQEIVAEKALAACCAEGGWCMLNNAHLVEKWMKNFEKIMEGYSEVYAKMAAVDREKAMRRAARKQLWMANELKSREKDNNNNTTGENGEEGENEVEGPTEPDAEELLRLEKEFEEYDAKNGGDGYDEEDDPYLVRGSMDFRIFLSAEPSNVIPISILQRSIKLTSEPPTGIKQNVSRALKCFSDEPWEKSSKPTEFRAVIFAMCYFHAVVVERKKFGAQGWNRVYPYNIGDLTTCIDVLANYIEDRPKIPWDDIRYVFGEIMYGGHITDDWDRVLCMAYLNQWIIPEVTDNLDLCNFLGSGSGQQASGTTGGAEFLVPNTPMTFAEFEKYIEENCPEESPLLYGLHPNAEINYRTVQAQTMFAHISELQPKSGPSSGGGSGNPGDNDENDDDNRKNKTKGAQVKSIGMGETPNDIVWAIVEDLIEKMPEPHNLQDIADRLEEDRTPIQHVFYQECERMNILLDVMSISLRGMALGLKGELSMSEEMQEVFTDLLLGRVPKSWMTVSFASIRPLATWFESVQQRYNQCNDWTGELSSPTVILLNLFFNPMSLLTALMQQTSIQNNYDLDQMGLLAEVTKKIPDNIDVPARDGAFIYGLIMEGARWDSNTNSIESSRMKELYPKMPVILIKSLPLSKLDRRDQYECPMYKTQTRGPTFIVGLYLKTKAPPRKWTIAGVGLILDVAE